MKKVILFLFISFSINLFCQSGAALNLDGINDVVNLPNNNGVFNTSSAHLKTYQIWFRSTAFQGQNIRIFSTGTANWTTGVWFGFLAGSPYLRFELSDGIGTGVAATATTSIRGDNTWHNATGVINGSIAYLYLDGNLEASVNISSEGTMNAAIPIHIGNSYDNEFQSWFKGDVDELRVWDRPLCQTDILATLNCELTGTEQGLLTYYNFNCGIASGNNTTVTTLPDLTVLANTGTLTNMALTGPTSNWISPGGVTSGLICSFSSQTLSVSPTNTSVCAGISTTFIANGALTYSWSPSLGLSSTSGSTVTAAPTTSQIYTVTGSLGGGCVASQTAVVTVTLTPAISITADHDPLCKGNSTTIYAHGATTYTWYPGIITPSLSVSPLVSTVYTVSGSSNVSGCVGTNTILIAVSNNTAPVISVAGPDSVCAGQAVNLAANGALTYSWQPGNMTGFYISVSPAVTTNYTVTGADANGCYNMAQYTQNVYACHDIVKSNTDSFNIIIPNVFSPNTDGVNDSWFLDIYKSGVVIKKFDIKVYNRWGVMCFSTVSELTAWDGRTTSGLACSEGVYFYVINYVIENRSGLSKEAKMSGFITLVR